jgi:hypothetical protein
MKITTAAFCALFFLLPGVGALLFSSCNQDDVFYQIEYETELRDPLIKGGPSKIVELGGALYVASGKIWTYPKGGGWKGMSNQPPGTKVLDIAATSGYLYAVTSDGVGLSDSGYYRCKKNTSSWEPIAAPPEHPNPTAIYSAGEVLFAGAASGSNYAVYALKDNVATFTSPPVKKFSSLETGRLLGAVEFDGKYFFSLDGEGVFHWNGAGAPVPVTGSAEKGDFTGLIEIDNALLMVSTSGLICKLSSASDSVTGANSRSFDNRTFTGVLTVWNDPSGNAANRLLLLGRKGSNTNYSNYGYYECPIPLGFNITVLSIREPQVTVEKNAAYSNSLGKRALNAIYQAPAAIDSVMPVFASTQKDNLWACRNGVWNYE